VLPALPDSAGCNTLLMLLTAYYTSRQYHWRMLRLLFISLNIFPLQHQYANKAVVTHRLMVVRGPKIFK
jgi:hypothetical protein